jgi:glycosyltransferase involved in cell wall biosynthesis
MAVLRICLVYDHLYPYTVGGIERWMRDLALRLVDAGHEVTYLTMRPWSGEHPDLPGVTVVSLVRTPRVYGEERRTLLPPLFFGIAVLRHLMRTGARYDVVHTASFPYFPLLAAAVARRRSAFRLVVDWHEVWTRSYWRSYAGALVGNLGWLVQRLCVAVPQRAFCVSRLHAERLRAEGFRGTISVLPGLYAGPVEPSTLSEVELLIVYAGRHVREKRVQALVRAFEYAHQRRPDLRLELYGDGPTRPAVQQLVRNLGLEGSVRVLGHRSEEEVASALARAACVATASEREGYGLVVVEAAARGTPSVVVRGLENAATELVIDGVNGVVAPSSDPRSLGDSLLGAIDGGAQLRTSTALWFAENAGRLRLENSLAEVLACYTADGAPGSLDG